MESIVKSNSPTSSSEYLQNLAESSGELNSSSQKGDYSSGSIADEGSNNSSASSRGGKVAAIAASLSSSFSSSNNNPLLSGGFMMKPKRPSSGSFVS